MRLRRTLTRERLARRVTRRLRRAGATDIRYEATQFAVHYRPAGATTRVVMYLETLFREVSADRRRLAARVAGYVDSFAVLPGPPGRWDQACPLLRPVLRGGAAMAPAGRFRPPLRRPVLPYLAEMVVVDLPDTMTYVTDDQVQAWGVTPDDVFGAARTNLSVGGPPPGDAPAVLRFVDDGSAYWTSHLLVDGWLAGLADRVGGRPVAFAPERATLLVVADDAEMLPQLFALAEEDYRAAPRAITPMAYVSDARGRTVPYAAPPGHPLHDQVRRAERVLAATEYAHQARALDPTLGEPLPLRLLDATGAGTVSRVHWPGRAEALLPTADEVEIDDDGRLVVAPWPDLLERGLLGAVDGLDPPRWRMTRPAAGTLAALRR